MKASTPIVLVSREAPVLRPAFDVTQMLTPEAVIRCKGKVITVAHIALVDPHAVRARQALVAALYLHNSGMTVVIGNPQLVPGDLVAPINAYRAEAKELGKVVPAEILVMEDAMHMYGDISDVVRSFEDCLS
ncbi:hypothetical protein [Nonomuraea sp. KM90]|uniref:hypothetical protein n=1 Tax=Nonomuraea sp. KM90 TaxID=3457428 RepID=UPI003FCC66F6